MQRGSLMLICPDEISPCMAPSIWEPADVLRLPLGMDNTYSHFRPMPHSRTHTHAYIQMPWDLACYRLLVYTFEVLFDLPVYWTGSLIRRHHPPHPPHPVFEGVQVAPWPKGGPTIGSNKGGGKGGGVGGGGVGI